MEKVNCWEFHGCGRQPGGSNVPELGTCPVTTEKKLDGIHGGINAGRSCWVVGGTLCNGRIQQTFLEKYDGCMECAFYRKVKEEESSDFILSATLYMMLH